jgi:hypothetical protein
MIKIVGYWDIWYQHKESEYDISWRFMLKHFGVDEVILIPNYNTTSKISWDSSEVPLVELDSVTEALQLNPNLTPIMVDERGTTSLKSFIHPENVMYIFGRTGFNPMDELQWSDESIFIESTPSQLGNALLHPNQACSIVLYDRLTKSWQ